MSSRNSARRRLKRDLIELEQANIPSISARPLDNDLFEWHVNIKPTDGVYAGVYFHLIMKFPDNYPAKPPSIKVCTSISHPNVFGDWLCLSMLRAHTSTQAYEGWSSAYSATSVCLQLQSFLFADKIDQDGGYQARARLSQYDIKRTLDICRKFKCTKCSHSFSTPWPRVKGVCVPVNDKPDPVKVLPVDSKSEHAIVQGLTCQSNGNNWASVYGELGFNFGKVMYEISIDRIDGSCLFGFGSEYAKFCGREPESFGIDGYSFQHDNKLEQFGDEGFAKGDTITCAVDFGASRIYFAQNGEIMEEDMEMRIPQYLDCGLLLYPTASFKNAQVEFNFGKPKRPCQWLLENGFRTVEHRKISDKAPHRIDWHSDYVIDELWLSIFECLQVPELNRVQFTCTKWNQVIQKYNIMERNEIFCFHSKARLGNGTSGSKIFGIGLSIVPSKTVVGQVTQVVIHSQMDILSRGAWQNGCRHGVWGEEMTHFLPLAMNKQHSQLAYDDIIEHLDAISKVLPKRTNVIPNHFEKTIASTACLQSIDTLITMMNQIVVQFVMNNQTTKTVSMTMCEKVVLGYCALNHLLLLLRSKNKKIITQFADKMVYHFIHKSRHKRQCRDLGQFLIWMMLSSKYEWCDVAKLFVEESFSRKVRWMVKNPECKHLNTTAYVENRLRLTLDASKISRRLVMFQVWFMKNTTTQTLKGYNDRLGRPQSKVRSEIFAKSKFILNSNRWSDYFDELDVVLNDDNAIDQLLRYSVYRSKEMGYHYANNGHPNSARQGREGYQNGYSRNNYPHQRRQQPGSGAYRASRIAVQYPGNSMSPGPQHGRQPGGFGGGMIRPQMNSNEYGNQMRNSRFNMPSDIEFMKAPQIKVKGARKLSTRKKMDRQGVHKQNVNRTRNGSRKFHNVTASLAMGPVQSGYNSPVSSTTTSSTGKQPVKLSKSQRARMRKRLAKERKKEAQQYYS